MARVDLSVWVPEEQGSNVLKTIALGSAVEALATKETMNSDTKAVPVQNGVSVAVVAKGAAYGEDVTADAELILQSRKFGTAVRMADEDLKDSPANIIAAKQEEWAKSYATLIDNACLGTSAVANGTTVPFNSVYYRLTQTDAANGYTANANIVTVATAVAVAYSDLSALIAKVEAGNAFGDVAIIAHPTFKQYLRDIKDTAGNPIFVQGLAGTPDTIFGYDIIWSRGARKNATASSAPTGNPLMFAVSKEYLLLGTRSGPESALAGADSGASFLTDEALLKMRARRAFQLGNPQAAAVIDKTP
jgi:HK97 family phage major capsid protein